MSYGDLRRVALLGAMSLCAGCLCSNDPIADLPSPDGRHRALLFSRNCGATTGPNVQLSIVDRGDAGRAAGNAFIADAKPSDSTHFSDPSELVDVSWLDDSHVQVIERPGLRVFKRNGDVDDVTIHFVRAE